MLREIRHMLTVVPNGLIGIQLMKREAGHLMADGIRTTMEKR